jgi:hypothetical protein
VEFERQRLVGERTLPSNAPTIDDFRHGVALSIKSIDLNAPWYRDPLNLSRRLDRYVDQLQTFDRIDWGGATIREEQITGKVLDIVVPKNSITRAQRDAIARSTERAARHGVYIITSPY